MAMKDPRPAPPGVWRPARRAIDAFVRPLERFLRVEASSGFILLGAALIALIWANSPLRGSYERLWRTPLVIGVGAYQWGESLHFFINDVLMVVFFLVV